MSQVDIDLIYRRHSRRVFATLVRLLGNFELAEEALHEAFVVATERWPQDGIPDNPSAWLVSTGRFKVIDQLRRQQRFTAWGDVKQQMENFADHNADPTLEPELLEDDRLRLIFTCCHPSLSEEARIALTLREVCGLSTEAIAQAFLLPPSTLAQRIVRAKAKIRDARIPYQVPEAHELGQRLQSVLRVIYLVFNEGYSASYGDAVLQGELSLEAIRLARLLRELLHETPHTVEITGLLALMLLQESRRAARVNVEGDLVPLEEQDRKQWDASLIAEGCTLTEQALRTRGFGTYSLQAAIAAVHAEASSAQVTDWAQIVGLYDVLLVREPSPIVALNRAVAVAMLHGPKAGLDLMQGLMKNESLQRFHLAHAAMADLQRRLGNTHEAHKAYRRALELAKQEPERKYLLRRLSELPTDNSIASV